MIINKPKIKQTVLIAIVVLLLSINSFLSLNAPVFEQITPHHEEFFRPKLSQDVPAVVKIIGMWGFWREDGYITTYKTLPLPVWYALMLMFPILMLIGYLKKRERKEANFFLALWWIGVIFATGASHPLTEPLFTFLFNYIPFFNGFRDSHKFVALIVLAYAFLCPIGIYWLRDKAISFLKKHNLRNWVRKTTFYAVPTIFVALIVLYTYPLIGLWGQVQPCDYPDSYQETNSFLLSHNISGHVIYVPWELYLTYNWTTGCNPDGRIANPINNVVEPVVITSPGQWGGKTNLSNNIGNCLNKNSTSCLEDLGVQYVLKDKCRISYPNNYTFINNIVHEDDCIEIYELNNSIDIDRSVKPPLRFIIGSIISLTTLIGIIVYLIIDTNKNKKKLLQK